MRFSILCFVLVSSLVAAIPRSHRVQDPLEREISLEPLLNTRTAFTRAALDYYLNSQRLQRVNYVPKEINLLFRGVNGRVDIPNDPDAIIAYVKRTPELAKNVDDVMDLLMDNLSEVSLNTKDLFQIAPTAVKNDVAKTWPEAYNLLESNFATNFAAAAKKFADGGLSMDSKILTADADPSKGSQNQDQQSC
ncbi:unnamed protein product [Cylicocyclus nassatus]|uniref:Uncharacterized protein n=1 Tax=Cylicocyclus nassatus TaxID=53992 RepID=A0AA36M5T0_CYLNA|nr:unnamed protein product [Cylicocyclus nassatus]